VVNLFIYVFKYWMLALMRMIKWMIFLVKSNQRLSDFNLLSFAL